MSDGKELKLVVERALRSVFPKANIYVDHDLIGAAYATWDDTPAITGILGTGSNSCWTVRCSTPQGQPSHRKRLAKAMQLALRAGRGLARKNCHQQL
jgi:hypothetical protein